MIEQLNKIADVWWSWMWPMSWQVSLLVVFIGVADLFLRKRVWPQVRYALWLLIMVKLILPPTFSLSTSVVSQLRLLAEQAIMQQTSSSEFPAAVNFQEDLAVAKPLADTSAEPVAVLQGTEQVDVLARPNEITAAAGAARPSWQVYVMLGWLLGVLILATWLIVKFRQLRAMHYRKVDEADLPQWLEQLLSETAKKLNLKHLPEIILTQSVSCPAVFGVFRPVLLLPKQNIAQISRKDTEHILLHELAHIKCGDLWMHGIYMVLQLIYWFNPLLWLVRRKLQHLRELCCDATVATILREKTADYRETILQTAEWLLDKPKISGIGILGLVERPSRLLARLNWLEKKTWRYQKMKRVTIITVAILMITFVLPMAKAEKSEKTDTAANIEHKEKSTKLLHQAAATGDVDGVKELISKGADVNAKDDGWSPLHYAAKHGHRDVVRLIIANGADVNAENAENGEYETPLYFAAKHGHKDVAEILIAKGADVNARGGWGATPLYYSAEHGKKDVAELLIAKGADVNARDMWGETVLEAACWSGHGDVAELLVAKGADVNAKDMWGYTPLYYATCSKPDRDTVKLLVDKGADVNFVREGGYPYLNCAVRKKNLDIVKLLVAHGARLDVKDKDGWTSFRYAAVQGNRDIIEFFVSEGADISTFHKAASVGDLNRVKLFVQRGADVNEKDELGWTPLFFAASLGQTEVAEFLIDNGSDIHAKISDGRTALHQALQVGAAKLAELLIAKGADVNAKTAKGQTPLHEAVRTEHGRKLVVIAVIEEIIAKGADVNAKNNDGCTPMHLTAMKGHRNVAKLLLAKGANVNAMNKYGYTPLDFALWPGYSKGFVEFLRKHGAKE